MQLQFRDVKTNEVFTVELKINSSEIAHVLAARANKSKAGKARAMNGAIVCTVVKRGDA